MAVEGGEERRTTNTSLRNMLSDRNNLQHMTDNLPNYAAMNPPAGTDIEDLSTHQRRALLLQVVQEQGGPSGVNQSRFADRCDVHRSTIARDMERLRESLDEHLGDDAKLTTRALFEKTIQDLHDADDWRASKAAWDVVMDWNDWLADVGEQHREPQKSQVDVDADVRRSEIQYRVVREGDAVDAGDDSEETDGDGNEAPTADEQLGFTATPASIELSDDE